MQLLVVPIWSVCSGAWYESDMDMGKPNQYEPDEPTSDHSGEDADDDTPQLSHAELIDDLLARVTALRNRREAIERERNELRKACDQIVREREQLRRERDLALRRAAAAELRLAEVQARISALEDTLRQRRGA
jgi:chromosome segregation ATPase